MRPLFLFSSMSCLSQIPSSKGYVSLLPFFIYCARPFSCHKKSWPSGLRRYVKAVVFIGVGSNPTDFILFFMGCVCCSNCPLCCLAFCSCFSLSAATHFLYSCFPQQNASFFSLDAPAPNIKRRTARGKKHCHKPGAAGSFSVSV